jgi:hypothetical protein
VTGDGPKEEGEGDDKGRDEEGDPDGASKEELLYVGLADAERAEWGGLGLAEED